MPLDPYKERLIKEAQESQKILTIFYKKRDGDRVRREVEPYEVKTEITKSFGKKTFLYAYDVTATTPIRERTIKKFDVDNLSVVIVNKAKQFVPRYETRIAGTDER